MKHSFKNCLSFLIVIFISLKLGNAQTHTEQKVSVEELFSLVEKNHPSLKVVQADIDIAKQNLNVIKDLRLPEISTALQASYVGNAYMIEKDFSNATKVEIPHFGNRFAVEAKQIIWKGGKIKNTIESFSLREEIAQLSYQSNSQDIKLLVLGYYLDLYKLTNQEQVYLKNIELAEKRLANINNFYNQGMVTRNDVIRGELQLSNLKLALQVVINNQAILSEQLRVALGLDSHIRISARELIVQKKGVKLDNFTKKIESHPSLMQSKKAIDMQNLSYKITSADRLPTLSLFAGNNLQRPFTTATPALDIYTNTWNAGVSLHFSLDALFKVPKQLQLSKSQIQKSELQYDQLNKSINVAVNSAYIKYNEAISQNLTLVDNSNLAVENYRIMESKYNNQLAILLDLIDASNTKLDAELQATNSEANIVFAYYKLQKESGNL